MSTITKNNTYFNRIKNRRLTDRDAVRERIDRNWSDVRNGFAAYITHEPQFKKGTIATQVRSYLSRRTNPATINEIVSAVMKNRRYANSASARRSVVRVLGQLSNWRIVTPQQTSPVSFMLNSKSK